MATSSISASIDENDTVTILAELVANAPNNDVRDCLRRYNCKDTLKKQTAALGATLKDTLIKTAEYLNTDPHGLKKDELISGLISRIQNLLPDTCKICNEHYRSKLQDLPFFSCEVCGQEVHKPCFMKLFGTTDPETVPNINPWNISGIHYICVKCEDMISSKFNIDHLFGEKTTALPDDDATTTAHIPTTDVPDEGIIHSSQIPSGSGLQSDAEAQDGGTEPEIVLIEDTNPTTMSADCAEDSPPPPAQKQNLVNGTTKPTSKSVAKENHKSSTDANTSKRPDVNTSKSPNDTLVEICPYYKKNICRYGVSGKGCNKHHPARCKKLMQHGTRQPDGCNKGKQCSEFHPKMCPTSITKNECFDIDCTGAHVRGTNFTKKQSLKPSTAGNATTTNKTASREAINPISIADSRTQSEQLPPKSNETNGCSFLEIARLIKEEVMKAMTLALSQLPQANVPPASQINHAMPQMPQIPPNPGFPPYFTPYPQNPPFQQYHQQQQIHSLYPPQYLVQMLPQHAPPYPQWPRWTPQPQPQPAGTTNVV